jgi:threonine synthase
MNVKRMREMMGTSPNSSFGPTVWAYRDRLPDVGAGNPVSLGEGGTPLLRSRLCEDVAFFWKDESRNPTGSHKDRALSLAATHALSVGAKVMVVVSAGSTGLSNAAYAARAGLKSVTLMARGAPVERIHPVVSLGSRLIELDCGMDEAIEALRRIGGRDGIYVASTTRSSNAIQAEAPKTIAFEIADQLDGDVPDWILVPTGGGGTIAGIHRGFAELLAEGRIARLPRLVAIVPNAYDALRRALADGVSSWEDFAALPYGEDIPTVLTKLSHGHPPDGLDALEAIRATEGAALAFRDERAIDAVAEIGGVDGLYLEPSSAIVLPALRELVTSGQIRKGETVVGLGCGSGFRETFVLQSSRPLRRDRADLTELHGVILSAAG